MTLINSKAGLAPYIEQAKKNVAAGKWPKIDPKTGKPIAP